MSDHFRLLFFNIIQEGSKFYHYTEDLKFYNSEFSIFTKNKLI